MKLGAIRHDDVASLVVTDHEAVFSFDQVQGYEKAQACIQPVLVALTRRGLLSRIVDPLSEINEAALPEFH
jgi:hypothetical protein